MYSTPFNMFNLDSHSYDLMQQVLNKLHHTDNKSFSLALCSDQTSAESRNSILGHFKHGAIDVLLLSRVDTLKQCSQQDTMLDVQSSDSMFMQPVNATNTSRPITDVLMTTFPAKTTSTKNKRKAADSTEDAVDARTLQQDDDNGVSAVDVEGVQRGVGRPKLRDSTVHDSNASSTAPAKVDRVAGKVYVFPDGSHRMWTRSKFWGCIHGSPQRCCIQCREEKSHDPTTGTDTCVRLLANHTLPNVPIPVAPAFNKRVYGCLYKTTHEGSVRLWIGTKWSCPHLRCLTICSLCRFEESLNIAKQTQSQIDVSLEHTPSSPSDQIGTTAAVPIPTHSTTSPVTVTTTWGEVIDLAKLTIAPSISKRNVDQWYMRRDRPMKWMRQCRFSCIHDSKFCCIQCRLQRRSRKSKQDENTITDSPPVLSLQDYLLPSLSNLPLLPCDRPTLETIPALPTIENILHIQSTLKTAH